MFIDIATCFVLFKMHWGYGLFTEIDGIVSGKKPKDIVRVQPIEIQKEEQVEEQKSKEEVVVNDNDSGHKED